MCATLCQNEDQNVLTSCSNSTWTPSCAQAHLNARTGSDSTLARHYTKALQSPLPTPSDSSASTTLIATFDRAPHLYLSADKYQCRARRESHGADAGRRAGAWHMGALSAATSGRRRYALGRGPHPPW